MYFDIFVLYRGVYACNFFLRSVRIIVNTNGLFLFYILYSIKYFFIHVFKIMNSSLVSTTYRRAPAYILLLNRVANQRTAATAAPLASAPVTSESLINEQRPQSKESKEHEKTKQQRLTPTPSSKEKVVQADKQLRTSTSFVMNLFRGQFYHDEIFPYPNVLTEEQRDNVKMFIDPIWKFFEEKNDAAKNDQIEKVKSIFYLNELYSFYSDSR